MRTERQITVAAPAKINLFLDVVKKRADGYHDIETIFAKISLSDSVTVRVSRKCRGVELKLVNKSGCRLSAGADNLAVKAAQLFLEEFGLNAGIRIKLVKRIPIGAGLGGGSSDGAAVLRALRQLFPDAVQGKAGERRLMRLALKLGSDVPFFLQGAPFCAGRGRGEKLKPFTPSGRLPYVALFYPGVAVYTAEVYRRLDLTKTLLTPHENLNKFKSKLVQGMGPTDWGRFLYNSLESVVLPLCPAVKSLVKQLQKAGDYPVLMTGSGSCVFALIPQQKIAPALLGKLRGVRGFAERFLGELGYGHNGDTRAPDERGKA